MRKYIIISVLAFASCTGSGDKKTETVNEPVQNKEYCFLLAEGNDTTTVHFTVDAGKVSGVMTWIPQEKDRRKGVLAGTAAGDEIKATWIFTQEGTTDSINVAFKLSSQQLAQKPLKANTANGRLETDETAGYTLLYKPANCNE